MYQVLLALHSLVRWAVLISLLFAVYRAYRGWLSDQVFTQFDERVRALASGVAQLQLLLGLSLYYVSPLIRYFLNNYKEAVHVRGVRFFGMEHSLMMLVAVVLITIGGAKVKRGNTDNAKFKTMAVWFTIALVLILVNVPWPFSFFANRPYFRAFLSATIIGFAGYK